MLIGPSDVLQIEVFQEADLLKQVRVAADGTVVLPLIGKVSLAADSIIEAEDKIKSLYAKSYFVDPHVNLSVVEFAPQGVQVLGQVQSPGYVPIPPEETMTLSKAIAGAHGMNLRADYSCVRVKRTLADGKVTVMKVNFNQVIKHPDT